MLMQRDDDERRCKSTGELQLKIKRNETFEYLYEVLKLLINIYIYIHIYNKLIRCATESDLFPHLALITYTYICICVDMTE